MPFFKVLAGQHVGKNREIFSKGGVFFDDRLDHVRDNPTKYAYAYDAREESGAKPPIGVELTDADRAALFPPGPPNAADIAAARALEAEADGVTPQQQQAPARSTPATRTAARETTKAPATAESKAADEAALNEMTVPQLDEIILNEELDVDLKLHKADKIEAIIDARAAR